MNYGQLFNQYLDYQHLLSKTGEDLATGKIDSFTIY